MYSDGPGDLDSFYNRQNEWNQSYPHKTMTIQSSHIQWLNSQSNDSVMIRRGECISPMAKELPPESKMSGFHLVEATESAPKQNDDHVYIVMLAGCAETGISARLYQARELAKRHGWASLILDTAYYASRRPKNQVRHFHRQTVDAVKTLESTKREGTAMALWILKEHDPKSRVCFTGFSFGAGMSLVCTGLTLKSGIPGERLSVAAYCPAATFATAVTGIFRNMVDRNLFACRRYINNEFVLQDFDRTNIFSLTGGLTLDGSSRIASGRMVYALHDGAINRSFYEDAAQYLKGLTITEEQALAVSKQVGGHAFAYTFRSTFHMKLIEDTVKSMLQRTSGIQR